MFCCARKVASPEDCLLTSWTSSRATVDCGGDAAQRRGHFALREFERLAPQEAAGRAGGCEALALDFEPGVGSDLVAAASHGNGGDEYLAGSSRRPYLIRIVRGNDGVVGACYAQLRDDRIVQSFGVVEGRERRAGGRSAEGHGGLQDAGAVIEVDGIATGAEAYARTGISADLMKL